MKATVGAPGAMMRPGAMVNLVPEVEKKQKHKKYLDDVFQKHSSAELINRGSPSTQSFG
jgi:hypothetical protein